MRLLAVGVLLCISTGIVEGKGSKGTHSTLVDNGENCTVVNSVAELMSRSFYIARISPDYVTKPPTKPIYVEFAGRPGQRFIENGEYLRPSQMRNTPKISANAPNANHYYSIILKDLDALNAKGERYENFLWFLGNLGPKSKGDVIIPYTPPISSKELGCHRYCMVMYDQGTGKVPAQEWKKSVKNVREKGTFKFFEKLFDPPKSGVYWMVQQ